MVFQGWSRWTDAELPQHTKAMIITILAATVVLIIGCKWWMKIAKRGKPPLPPGPRGLPLVGNLPFVEPDLHIYFAKLSETFGPIFKIQMGSKLYIVVNSPSLARQIFKEDDAIFANHEPPAAGVALTYGGRDILWRPNDPEWRNLRKVFVHELMSKTSLDGSYSLRRREVQEMVKGVYRKVGSPINVADQMFLTALNVAMSMLWGGSLNFDEKKRLGLEFRQVIEELSDLLGKPNISDFFPLLAPFDLQGIVSQITKLRLWFDGIFESVIAEKMSGDGEITKRGDGNKDFLQFLLELKEQEKEKSSLSMTDIKALFMDIITGATDTTSTTIEWAMTELLKNPEIMKKTQEELDSVVGQKTIVEEFHLYQLHYLEAVLKETMRLHPVVPLLIPHIPGVSTTLAGYTIPKGSNVFCNVWSIMRDPEAWENPLEFQPERFLKDVGIGDYKGNNFNYLPFGSGRRICAGIPLAERMVMHVLATLLHSFDWKLPDGTELDLSERFGIVLKKMVPLVAVPTARLSSPEQYI